MLVRDAKPSVVAEWLFKYSSSFHIFCSGMHRPAEKLEQKIERSMHQRRKSFLDGKTMIVGRQSGKRC